MKNSCGKEVKIFSHAYHLVDKKDEIVNSVC